MFSLACVFAISLVTANVQPATADAVAVGHWDGIVQVRPAEHEVDFSVDLQRLTDGKLGGSISFLTQDDPPQALDSVKVTGQEIVFATHDEKSSVTSSFQGRLLADGTLKGELVEGDGRYPFTARRQDHQPPPPIVNLQDLTATGDNLVDLFNKDRGNVRLVAILSPTCPMCRNGARILEHYVLDKISDPNLRVYIVWEHIRDGDSRQQALKAATFAADPRVTSFWSESRVTGEAFREKVGFKTSPAWDVFLVFPPGVAWDKGTAPAPKEIMCNLMGQPQDSAGLPRFNGVKLGEQVKALLADPKDSASPSPQGGAAAQGQHPN